MRLRRAMRRVNAGQGGAALLAAMVTVALVATLASAALWLQWRQVEVESAERGRNQTLWLMTGAMDWTRLILAEDARTAQGVDHLGEPWALPIQESKLSTFLSQDQQWREGDPEVYLSGRIIDAQSRLNLTSLFDDDGKISPDVLAAWKRLFERLNLPLAELDQMTSQLALASRAAQKAQDAGASGSLANGQAPLLPSRVDQLVWLGLSPATVEALRPSVTILPEATPVNLNTAGPIVLEAAIEGLDSAGARQLVQKRGAKPWASTGEAAETLGPSLGRLLNPRLHDVRSRFFEIQGRLRIERVVQDEQALVDRQNNTVRMLWRSRLPPLQLPQDGRVPPLQ